MRKALLFAAAVSVAAALLAAPTAGASRYIKSGIFDDSQILFGNPDKVFPELAKLKTQVIRANMYWGGPTGWGVSRRRPADAADPADPAYDWSTYDRTVQFAARNGMKVVFSIIGTPPWANAAAGFNVVPTKMSDLRLFAEAAGRRYDGTYKGPDGTILPAVTQWIAWNEPNNPIFLRPQFTRSAAGKWIPQAAYDYAKMCNAIVTGIKSGATAGRPLVACGVTGPKGNNQPGAIRSSLSPLAFLRAMKKGGAKGFDAYAHHPYSVTAAQSPSTPPPPAKRGAPPTAVTLGNIDVLIRELTRLYGNTRVWITEYGYQTNPPDAFFGVTPAKQALYMKEAWKIAKANPRIDLFLWFLLRDERRVDAGWQSGLLTAAGAKKPAYAVFPTLR